MYCQRHFQSTLCRWPDDLFSRMLSGHHRETSTAGSECHTGMGDKDWLQVCSPQVQSHTFHCTTVSGPLWGLKTHFYWRRSPQSSLGCGGTRTSHLRSTPVCWRHSARKLSTSSEWSSGHLLEMGRGQRHTLDAVPCHCSFQVWLWLHCVWHSIKHQPTTTRQHSLLWTETGIGSILHQPRKAPLEERRLKLSMHYYVKTRACIDNQDHALHEFERTTRDLYAPRPNGRGGMTRPPAPPIGLKVEEAMTSAEINAELVCPLRTPNFPPGTHDYDPKRHDLIEGVSKCMISGQEAQA